MFDHSIPAEDFTLEVLPDEIEAPTGLKGFEPPKVSPRVSVHGSTITIRLTISASWLGSDTQTFSLTPKNRWSDKHTFFDGKFINLKKFSVGIAAETGKRRVRIHFSKKPFAEVTRYVPYANFQLPTDYASWRRSDPALHTKMKGAWETGGSVSQKAPQIHKDTAGPGNACALLGAPGFLKDGRAAMAEQTKAMLGNGTDDWLIGIGILDDAGIAASAMLGTGFWFTTGSGRSGWYSTIGADFGNFVGIAASLVVTVIGGPYVTDPVEDFERFQIARGLVGEGVMGSFGFIGDAREAEIHGIVAGIGIGAQVSPASGYVGTARNFITEF